ncbi:hypothetical protein Pint_14454 [Pistacia integerrima]|uniref:Uncharacterized protein n=1 Tax=Pistacia integerrima TaxID=434235 RepID=A0ACC0Y4B6_9ROSI|nr:hypothetical protein Pint_14454 [Pistacia integerrima]
MFDKVCVTFMMNPGEFQFFMTMLISCSLNLIVQMQIVNDFQSFSSFMWGYVKTSD